LWRLRLHEGLPGGEVLPGFEDRQDLRRHVEYAIANDRQAFIEMRKVRVLYHDNCFDGVSSAAVFSRFYKGHIDPAAEIEYEGLTHKAGQHIGEDLFGPDENVIVDFKYAATDKLTWWFDHHESAFLSAQDEAHFRRDTSGHKFHDPGYKSCT